MNQTPMIRRFASEFLIVSALLMQSAVAQETEITGHTVGVESARLGLGLNYVKQTEKEYYPDKKTYEESVEKILESQPMCLDTEAHCKLKSSSGFEINTPFYGFSWQTGENDIQRPHQDPRVERKWESWGSVGGSTKSLGSVGVGGRID